MRVLMAEAFFPPPTGGAFAVAASIAVGLAERNHQVDVLCAMPTYRGRYTGPQPPKRERWRDGVNVRRIPAWVRYRSSLVGRAYTAATFSAQLLVHLLVRIRRSDMVITSTHPPILATAMVRWMCRLSKTPYVYHCQDLNPEAAVLAGLMHGGPVLALLTRLERKNRVHAAHIVVLSSDMARTLFDQGIPPARVSVINNFIGGDEPRTEAIYSAVNRERFTVLFAGNMGPLQQLGVVLEAARELEARVPRVHWLLAGDGPETERLKGRAVDLGLTSVEFRPFLPREEIRRLMWDCDLALVSIALGVERVAYPSKLLDYLREGCRILAVVEPSSELAALVERERLGAVAKPGDPSAIAARIVDELGRRPVRSERDRIVGVCGAYFGEALGKTLWMDLLESVARVDPLGF